MSNRPEFAGFRAILRLGSRRSFQISSSNNVSEKPPPLAIAAANVAAAAAAAESGRGRGSKTSTSDPTSNNIPRVISSEFIPRMLNQMKKASTKVGVEPIHASGGNVEFDDKV